jgi:hypothetical protein
MMDAYFRMAGFKDLETVLPLGLGREDVRLIQLYFMYPVLTRRAFLASVLAHSWIRAEIVLASQRIQSSSFSMARSSRITFEQIQKRPCSFD